MATTSKFYVQTIFDGKDKLSKTLNNISNNINKTAGRINKLRSGLSKMAGKTMGASLVAGGGLATGLKLAVDFEKQMANIAKFKQGSGSLNAFTDKIGKSVMKLSEKTGLANADISELYETIGASGIDMSKWEAQAKVIAKATVALGINAKDTAGYLLSMSTSMDHLGDSDWMELVSAKINAISDINNTNTLDVSKVAARGFGVAKAQGIDENQFLSITAATLASSKLEPETIARSWKKISSAMLGSKKPSKAMAKSLKKLGLTQKELTTMMKKDFVGGLQNLKKRVKETGAGLDVFTGLVGDNFNVAFLNMISSSDKAADGVTLLSDKIKVLSIQQNEYTVQQKTTLTNLAKLKNKFTNLGIKIGKVLLPTLNKVVDYVDKMMIKFDSFSKANPGLLEKIALFGVGIAALSPVLFGLSSALGVVTSVINVMKLALLSNPITALAVLIAGLGVTIYKNWDSITWFFKDFWNNFAGMAKWGLDNLLGLFGTSIDGIKNWWNGLSPILKAPFEVLGKTAGLILDGIIGTIKLVIKGVRKSLELFGILESKEDKKYNEMAKSPEARNARKGINAVDYSVVNEDGTPRFNRQIVNNEAKQIKALTKADVERIKLGEDLTRKAFESLEVKNKAQIEWLKAHKKVDVNIKVDQDGKVISASGSGDNIANNGSVGVG